MTSQERGKGRVRRRSSFQVVGRERIHQLLRDAAVRHAEGGHLRCRCENTAVEMGGGHRPHSVQRLRQLVSYCLIYVFSSIFLRSVSLRWMQFFCQAVWGLGKEVLPLGEGFILDLHLILRRSSEFVEIVYNYFYVDLCHPWLFLIQLIYDKKARLLRFIDGWKRW